MTQQFLCNNKQGLCNAVNESYLRNSITRLDFLRVSGNKLKTFSKSGSFQFSFLVELNNELLFSFSSVGEYYYSRWMIGCSYSRDDRLLL